MADIQHQLTMLHAEMCDSDLQNIFSRLQDPEQTISTIDDPIFEPLKLWKVKVTEALAVVESTEQALESSGFPVSPYEVSTELRKGLTIAQSLDNPQASSVSNENVEAADGYDQGEDEIEVVGRLVAPTAESDEDEDLVNGQEEKSERIRGGERAENDQHNSICMGRTTSRTKTKHSAAARREKNQSDVAVEMPARKRRGRPPKRADPSSVQTPLLHPIVTQTGPAMLPNPSTSSNSTNSSAKAEGIVQMVAGAKAVASGFMARSRAFEKLAQVNKGMYDGWMELANGLQKVADSMPSETE